MNKACLTGRITRDPELKVTPSGISVCSFSVAVDRPGTKDKVDFLDFIAWRASAEFVSKYFKKGDGIEIEGHITTRSYEDKNGNKRKAVDIVCDSISFPKSKKHSEGGAGTTAEPQQGANFEELPDDEELPF
jgi:single-strand DNA-binding protein